MNTLLNRLAQQAPVVLLVLLAVTLVLFLAVIWLTYKQRAQSARWRTLLKGSTGQSLENLLVDHLRDRMQLRVQLESAEGRLTNLEQEFRTAKRHIGLVRYDAFDEVSGSQSFALAVFDDNGDGAVISSLVGRSDCRVFCKPLVGGSSERNLSREEQRAMEEATRKGFKSVLS
jgi:hypothetical protein